MNEYVIRFMEEYAYPDEAVEAVRKLSQRLDQGEFGACFHALTEEFTAKIQPIQPFEGKLQALAESMGESRYTLNLLFLITCSEVMPKRYRAAGLSEELFKETFRDLRYKLLECMENYQVPGVSSFSWYSDFFALRLFAAGRFQYQFFNVDESQVYTTASGRKLAAGDFGLRIHIPSSGIPLTREVRMDSYRKAYALFGDHFENGEMLLTCGSWLLYPRHREFLPSHSHILEFMDDFEMMRWKEYDTFSNAWRVFGRTSQLPLDQWRTETSLQRAYVDWLKKGEKAGEGTGVLFFDGEQILH